MMLTPKPPVGGIIARFQVPELHPGHLNLIAQVRALHEDVAIFLGTRGKVRTQRDPLTFEEREHMLREAFPQANLVIKPLEDHPIHPKYWSRDLDALIRATFPGRKAVLYGSRGSFIPLYSGEFPTEELPTVDSPSGTAIREAIRFPHTKDARQAIIFDQQNRFPHILSTADLAIIDRAARKTWLIGKGAHEGKLSFAGGHADKTDGTARFTASREGVEEILGIRFGELTHIDTVLVDDPRYKGTPDGIMTAFFWADYEGGIPTHGDDADYVVQVENEKLLDSLVPWHQPLGKLLLENWPN